MPAGLVSISFRDHSPTQILHAAAACGLTRIEWGSDIHAPKEDPIKLRQIAQAQTELGISCCAYGTYFRLGHTPISELSEYIRAAKLLNTGVLRLWCGRKKQTDCTPEEINALLTQCRQATALAEDSGVRLCLECHRRSYTETREGALELMEAVRSPAFGMYWQPNPDISIRDNLLYIQKLRPYITNVHVFHWTRDARIPLESGKNIWSQYLTELGPEHNFLLEFMPDDRLTSLAAEAYSLHTLLADQHNTAN